jgi:glucan phosphoethanolaminetransferase (alkaline phosphatase superfamily)
MIQRIQTVFIFISGLLTASLFKFKLADLSVNNELLQFFAKGISNGESIVFDGLPIMFLIGLVALLHIVIIFIYKKRILQIRMLVFSILLLIGLFGMFFYFTYAGFDGAKVAFKIPVAFPIAAIILDWLAIRAIGKDEALIRSLNRIR